MLIPIAMPSNWFSLSLSVPLSHCAILCSCYRVTTQAITTTAIEHRCAGTKIVCIGNYVCASSSDRSSFNWYNCFARYTRCSHYLPQMHLSFSSSAALHLISFNPLPRPVLPTLRNIERNARTRSTNCTECNCYYKCNTNTKTPPFPPPLNNILCITCI